MYILETYVKYDFVGILKPLFSIFIALMVLFCYNNLYIFNFSRIHALKFQISFVKGEIYQIIFTNVILLVNFVIFSSLSSCRASRALEIVTDIVNPTDNLTMLASKTKCSELRIKVVSILFFSKSKNRYEL